MRVKSGFVVREVGGKKYAVATGEAARSFKGMLSLNDVGATIFKLLQHDTTEEAIVNAILDEYDADSEIVKADVANFVNQLRGIDVIVG
ncbi:MAG: PqqD family protein [Clostridia bacterium]|nr:PqqD family protein [Clostridia bacterium]